MILTLTLLWAYSCAVLAYYATMAIDKDFNFDKLDVYFVYASVNTFMISAFALTIQLFF